MSEVMQVANGPVMWGIALLTIAVVVVLAVFALIIGFAMGLAIAYQASIIRMINRTKTVAATGMADDRVSGYLVGMTGFSAVCSLISGLLGLFTAPLTGAAGIAGGVAVAAVCFGVCERRGAYPDDSAPAHLRKGHESGALSPCAAHDAAYVRRTPGPRRLRPPAGAGPRAGPASPGRTAPAAAGGVSRPR